MASLNRGDSRMRIALVRYVLQLLLGAALASTLQGVVLMF
jgi:hypothetical protein